MFNYLIQNITPLNSNLLKGYYLVILGVGKIPPHIALLSNGILHSLKVTGYKQEAISELLEVYKRKELPCLFFELAFTINNIEANFLAYKKASENVSCLEPIKDCLSQINTESVNYVFDLIAELENNNAVNRVCHLNLGDSILNGTYSYQKYTLEDINNRIEKLQKAL